VTSWEVRKETLLGEEERFTGEMEEELEVWFEEFLVMNNSSCDLLSEELSLLNKPYFRENVNILEQTI
jgi:hypothetical protein